MCNLDGPIRANRFADSCESPDCLAPPFCWTKFPKKVAKSETMFPKFSPKFAPKFAPKFFVLSWQVEKSSPKTSPDLSHRKFQISNRIPDQISPKISQTHFCRLGSPNDCRESFQGSRTEPFFCELRFGSLKIANRRFEAIRANRLHVMKVVRKILAPIKIKSALTPPNPPPLKGGILWTWVFPAERTHFSRCP